MYLNVGFHGNFIFQPWQGGSLFLSQASVFAQGVGGIQLNHSLLSIASTKVFPKFKYLKGAGFLYPAGINLERTHYTNV